MLSTRPESSYELCLRNACGPQARGAMLYSTALPKLTRIEEYRLHSPDKEIDLTPKAATRLVPC